MFMFNNISVMMNAFCCCCSDMSFSGDLALDIS